MCPSLQAPPLLICDCAVQIYAKMEVICPTSNHGATHQTPTVGMTTETGSGLKPNRNRKQRSAADTPMCLERVYHSTVGRAPRGRSSTFSVFQGTAVSDEENDEMHLLQRDFVVRESWPTA